MLWGIKRESPTSQLPGILQLHSIYIFSNPVKGGISSRFYGFPDRLSDFIFSSTIPDESYQQLPVCNSV